ARTRRIDVGLFVSRKELDPMYFESLYYVVPDTDRVRPFALMLRAMQQTNRAAICWVVLRSRRHLAALQPRGRFMLMSTLLFADEIIPTRDVEPILPSDLTEREIEMGGRWGEMGSRARASHSVTGRSTGKKPGLGRRGGPAAPGCSRSRSCPPLHAALTSSWPR